MIGPYSQFKGKLKAGDRVRVEYGGRTSLGEVNETSESGFTVRENMDEWRCVERFIFWTSEGTLELLSPSPRVVTDTEAPSLPLIAKFTVKAKGSVDYNNIIKMTNPTDKDVYAMVWDASPPAPAEKEEEWWESHFNRHFPNPEDSWIKTWAHFLVDEAMRRGEEKAWVDASVTLGCIEAGRDERWPENVPWNEEGSGWDALFVDMNKAIASKISSLNKPAGAGEN